MNKIDFGTSNHYMALDVWIMANIVQLATYDYCRRFLDRRIDPCGRQFDQMTQAARSGQANIAEGESRWKTSTETEMKLLDVARASLAELLGDYAFLLMSNEQVPWRSDSEEARKIYSLALERPHYVSDWGSESAQHILRQKKRFDGWLKSEDATIAANGIMILINRCINSLTHLLQSKGREFVKSGGFREKLTAVRIAARAEEESKDAPSCPICGGPMRRRTAKKGAHAGKAFWSCAAYPKCDGIMAIE